MADTSDTVSKEQHLGVICIALYHNHNPQYARSALVSAARYLSIPEPEHAISVLVHKHGWDNQPYNQPITEPESGVVKGSEKKEKSKRQLMPFNVFVVWFSDFAAHYGLHPAILKLKADNPATKRWLEMAAAFQKTLPSELQETVKRVLKPFCAQYSRQQKDGGDTMLQAYKKYVEQRPEADIGRVLGLDSEPRYKTDPAEVKAQAAEARRLAQATPSRVSPPAPTSTDVNTVSKIELAASTPAPMPTPMTPASKTEKTKEKSKRPRDEEGKENGEETAKKKKAKSEGAEEKKEKKEKKVEDEKTVGGKVEGAEVKKEKKEKGEKHKKGEEKHKEKK